MHCGFRLPPNHTGPCPNCGKTGTSAEVFGFGNISASAQVQVQDAIDTSTANAFTSHNTPVPEWWSAETKNMAQTMMPILQYEVQNEVLTALNQHDKEVEKKEKSLRNRVIKVGIALLTLLLGALLGWIANLFH